MTTRPKIGLLVTALLEDEYNKTGHLRPNCAEATNDLAKLLSPYGEIVNPGFVEYESDAEQAAQVFNTAGVDLIIVVELAYQSGANLMRALLATQAPILVWNTQKIRYLPQDANFDLVMLNYGSAGIPELTNALLRCNRPFSIITSQTDDPYGLAQIGEYATAAGVVHRLRRARIGIIGHPYAGMTDLAMDYLSLRQQLGPLCWSIEPEKVAAAAVSASAEKVRAIMEEEQRRFRIKDLPSELWERSVRLGLALEQVALDYHVDALATFEQSWLDDPRVGISCSYGAGRITSLGIPSVPEGDALTAVAMLLLQELTGQSTIVENYVMNFDNKTIMLSHDGTGNPALAVNPSEVSIKPGLYYRGVHGFGASFEFAYAPGDVTLLALVPFRNGRWRFVVAEGESLSMTPRTLAAPQMVFRHSSGNIEDYYNRWCLAGGSHHMALAYGRLGSRINRIGELLGIETVIV
ncbi:MAG: hypothetical protein ABSD49_13640 [Candidatus Bathyarchaeia archaeon]